MRTTIIRLVSMLGILLVLCAALVAVVRFYPYSYSFPAYPKITHTKSGANGDPINVLLVGSQEQIVQSFHQAGWLIPDPVTPHTSAKIAVDSLAHRSYPTAPVSPLYLFGRVQDLVFEKPTNDVQNRGHIRIWKTNTFISGQLVWVGAATYDSGIELSGTNHLPTHHIAPAVDLERNTVGADLTKTEVVKEEADVAFTPPILAARNGGGDYYTSDGDVLVINYVQTSLPVNQPTGVIEGLKDGVFLLYDQLFTIAGVLIAFLVLVAVLVAGLTLWHFIERSRLPKRAQSKS